MNGKTLVILGHPRLDSFNGAIADIYKAGAEAAGGEVEMLKLAELDFDPILRLGYRGKQELEDDLVHAQKAIESARHIVVVTPLWWGSVPALLKGFFDRTLLPGWAFKYQENGIPKKLLKGRSARLILTMDAPNWWYRLVYRRAAHASVVNATLSFVGLKPVKVTPIYGVQHLSQKQCAKWLEKIWVLAGKEHGKTLSPQALPAQVG